MGNTAVDIGDKDMAHYECINGKYIVKNATSTTHYRIVNLIRSSFEFYISQHKKNCEIFTDVVKLHCSKINPDCGKNAFLPDVMLICDPIEGEDIKVNGVYKAPKFVCEVLSKSTRDNDFSKKREVYQKIGVEEYWIVDPDEKKVYLYLLNDQYEPEVIDSPRNVTSRVCGVTVDFGNLLQLS